MIFKSYIDFWKRTFDFSGRSTRSDFWVPFLIHIFIFLFVFTLVQLYKFHLRGMWCC